MSFGKLNNKDREEWIQNDEFLYAWWIHTKFSLHRFLSLYKDIIDMEIRSKLNVRHP
jgi:hypothetical protein